MKSIAVIGSGNWGTALAITAGQTGRRVNLWARDPEIVESINQEGLNCRYMSEVKLPATVRATTDLEEAVAGAEVIIMATPSHALRSVVEGMPALARRDSIIVSATKGIEISTGKRMSEVVRDVMGVVPFVCLSGPSFAKEVVEGHPTAIVAAGDDSETNSAVQTLLSGGSLRIYTNSDLVGVELGGSVKNVIAIAAGMAAGLGFGSNSVAALITRGLAEMTRLAVSLGARVETMMGLAGLGDLVLTCTGGLSRNRYVGQELGNGRRLEDITAGMKEIAEGVKTTQAVKRLAAKSGVEMPITSEVHAVMYEDKPAREAVVELMQRPLREEF